MTDATQRTREAKITEAMRQEVDRLLGGTSRPVVSQPTERETEIIRAMRRDVTQLLDNRI